MFSRWDIGGEDYELLLYQKLLEHGLTSCPPLGQACPFDLVSVSRFTGATHKVQLKTVTKPYHNDTYRVRFTHGCLSKASYKTVNVDVFIVLLVPLQSWLVIPNREGLPKSLSVCAKTTLKMHNGYERWELLHRPSLRR
jgi:hypothetical protein